MSDEFLGTTNTQSAEVGTPAAEAPKVVVESKAEYTEFLQAITNPEGQQKYKTVADALIGAAKAQEHIQRIEQENAELRSVAKKVETLEQVLLNLEQGKPVQTVQVVPQIEDQEKLVLSVLEKQRAAEAAKANREQVLSALKERYGDKVNEALTQKANDLGLSVAELGQLASRSPKAVLDYFRTEVKGTPAVPSTVNTQALSPQPTEVKTPDNIMWGANTKDVVNFFRQVKEDVNRQLGI